MLVCWSMVARSINTESLRSPQPSTFGCGTTLGKPKSCASFRELRLVQLIGDHMFSVNTALAKEPFVDAGFASDIAHDTTKAEDGYATGSCLPRFGGDSKGDPAL